MIHYIYLVENIVNNFGKRGEDSPLFGRKHSAETKAKMSSSQKERALKKRLGL